MLEGLTAEQRLTISPFPRPGQRATWEPARQVIETAGGELIAERRDPATSFAGLPGPSRWDKLQAACFASEAGWNCFTAPFLFARAGFAVLSIAVLGCAAAARQVRAAAWPGSGGPVGSSESDAHAR